MEEKKLTDEERLKAYFTCMTQGEICGNCPCYKNHDECMKVIKQVKLVLHCFSNDNDRLNEQITKRDDEIERLESLLNDRCNGCIEHYITAVKQAICENTYPGFDKNGKPVIIWNTDGYDRLDEICKEIIKGW